MAAPAANLRNGERRRQAHPLAAVLGQVDAGSCPKRFNFHCHTTCSDGSLEPLALAEQALELGLEHLAVTDHHSHAAHSPMAEHFERLRRRGEPAPILWRGVEISCLLEGCLVHVLALGFAAQHESLAPYLQGRAVIGPGLGAGAVVGAIHAAGGLALLAHPARYRLPYKRLIQTAARLGFDGAETWYDYDQQARWQATPLICEAIATEVSELGLLMSCGTDTHGFALHGR